MTNQEASQNYGQEFTSDSNIRINDLEERTTNTREKINLVSKNFIFMKEEFDEKIEKIEKENAEIKNELTKLKRTITNISQESEKWVRRDELILIERMLKDFQPLEFVRKEDVGKLSPKKEKTTKRRPQKRIKSHKHK